MKKLLALLILSGLILSSCAIGRGGDIEQLDPLGTGGDTPTDTTDPIGDHSADVSDTTDTPVSDTVDTTSPEPDTTEPADTDEPDENIFFENEKYKVTVTEDGEYLYYCESLGLTHEFADAFVLEGRVYLVREGNGVCALYAPSEQGQLKSRMNASKFTKCGEFVWADGKLYDWQLVEIFELRLPWYIYDSYSSMSAWEYDEENSVLNIVAEYKDIEFKYEVYLALDTDCDMPGGSSIVAQDTSGRSAVHRALDGYYFTYDHLTVKVPVSGNFDDVSMLSDDGARFFRIVDGEIECIDVEFLFRKTPTGQYYVAFSSVTSNLSEIIEKTALNAHEYNGAQVLILEPKTYIVKDGEVIHVFDRFYSFVQTVGEFLTIGNPNMSEPYIVLKPDLTLFSESEFSDFIQLDDGNYSAIYSESVQGVIFDKDGAVIYESPEDIAVWDIGSAEKRGDDGTLTRLGDWMLAKFSDGTLRMLTPYGEELCNFGEISDNVYYHRMISGYYSKEGYPTGLYFKIEDKNDKSEKNHTHHGYEYYYSFETGEFGMIDLGYVDYAYAKPVLYLYPTEAIDVTVTFEHPERLTVDYPKYTDGWRVTAMPDGTLTGENGREYYALYWEEDSESAYYAFPDGFCVSGEDSAAFLEEKLAALGFTDKEANEFIIYWLPILEASQYNLIRFELTEEREASNALHITPAPDSLLRVAMHIKAVDAPVDICEQRLPAFERVGFVAVEWGGCIH